MSGDQSRATTDKDNNNSIEEFEFAPTTTAWQTTSLHGTRSTTGTHATGRSRRQAYGKSKRSASNVPLRSFSVPSASTSISTSSNNHDGARATAFQNNLNAFHSSWHNTLDEFDFNDNDDELIDTNVKQGSTSRLSNFSSDNRPPRSRSLQLQRCSSVIDANNNARNKPRRSISLQSSSSNYANPSPPMIRKQSFTLLQDQENFHPNKTNSNDDEALKPIKLMKVGSHNASSRSSVSSEQQQQQQQQYLDYDEDEEDDFNFRERSCSPAFSSAAQSVCSTGSFSELAAAKDSSSLWGNQNQFDCNSNFRSMSTNDVKASSSSSSSSSPPQISKSRVGPRTRFCYGSLNDVQTSSTNDDSSPSQSLTPSLGSSRKRCNYGSPIIEPDDDISISGRSSGKGSSLGRCRSRSRIFSPEFVSSQLDQANADDEDQSVNTAVDPFQDIRTNENDTDEENSIDLSKEISEDEVPPPPAPRRIPTPTFGQSKSENIDLKKAHKENLKYMYVALRKVVKSKKPRIFGASNNLPILPPNDWPSERRDIFLSWATTDLHFDMLSLGGNMGVYLRTSMERSVEVFEQVRKELRELKAERQVNLVRPIKDKIVATDHDCVGKTNTEKPSAMKTLSFRSPEPVGMDISAKKIIPSSMEVDKIRSNDFNCNEQDLAETLGNLSLSRQHFSPCDKSEVFEHSHHLDCSFDVSVINPRRMSHGSANGQDFLRNHCFGISPTPSNLRPPAIHLPPNNAPTMGRLSLGSASDFKSPFPSQIGEVASVLKQSGGCMDFIETPMPKRTENWGSRPILGRDWLTSIPCSQNAVIVCRNIYRTRKECSDGVVDQKACMEYSSSLFVNQSIAEVAVNGDVLGFEHECSDSSYCIDEGEENKEEPCSLPEIMMDLKVETAKKKKQRDSLAKHQRMSLCAASFRRSLRFSTSIRPAALFNSYAVSSGTDPVINDMLDEFLFLKILEHFSEYDLMCSVSLVCSKWADIAARAQATLMLVSVNCPVSLMNGEQTAIDCDTSSFEDEDDDISDSEYRKETLVASGIAKSMERTWKQLISNFPWGAFLSEGAFKRVYRAWNASIGAEEAVSVMDVDLIEENGNRTVVGTELAVSSLLSSLVRRNICPNFVLTRGVFTSPFEPPASLWGEESNRKPRGNFYNPDEHCRKPRQPGDKHRGKYQYIRMELCKYGDAEEFLADEPDKCISSCEARMLLFQMAFSLHVASDKYGLKHYDIKLLNFFLQDAHANVSDISALTEKHPYTALRYGLGDHVFCLRMPTNRTILAKLADYGTATFGMSQDHLTGVTIGQFTTIENTPPEQFILGDAALQGHGHDNFGLGLSMLHLFTGHCPYEEIMSDVYCPPTLRKTLSVIWEKDYACASVSSQQNGADFTYSVLRSLIVGDMDAESGEVYDVPYHTLYRFLVLFGIPNDKFGIRTKKNGGAGGSSKVWDAIISSLHPFGTADDAHDKENVYSRASRRSARNTVKSRNTKLDPNNDAIQFQKDCCEYSIAFGRNGLIASAREKLEVMKIVFNIFHFLSYVYICSLAEFHDCFRRWRVECSFYLV